MSGEQRVDAHLSDHTLWDVALGEPVGAAEHAHLAACRTCSHELEEREHVASAVAEPPPADLPLRPPPRVLAAVRTELGLAGPPSAAVPGPRSVRSRSVGPRAVGSPTVRTASRPRRAVLALAAAALVLAGAAVGAGLGLGLGGEPGGGTVLATADLDGLEGGGPVGTAVLHDDGDRRVLDVEMTSGGTGADPARAYEEVWLLGPDAQPLVSLGVLGDGRGSFVVPAVADGQGRLVVDVSVEPLDGGPEHSGHSVARGEMTG
ncbi:anti-sigma factor [Pseudokineococcus basanitobsidens]|uniref:Anti-sigma factor n=1 Tax=Pseudokineococcus basanitobsidens TaxID=1926649 RepID=A0ABU8RKQ2_9ACTN